MRERTHARGRGWGVGTEAGKGSLLTRGVRYFRRPSHGTGFNPAASAISSLTRVAKAMDVSPFRRYCGSKYVISHTTAQVCQPGEQQTT